VYLLNCLGLVFLIVKLSFRTVYTGGAVQMSLIDWRRSASTYHTSRQSKWTPDDGPTRECHELSATHKRSADNVCHTIRYDMIW